MNIKKNIPWHRWLPGACTVLLALLLVGKCLILYRSGAAGEYDPIFSRERVVQAFSDIAWAFGLWIGALAWAAAGEIIHPRTAVSHSKPLKAVPFSKPITCAKAFRAILVFAAIGLMAAGIINGGMRDVFIKAVNICTECIGLG